jgi:glycosyltransferase involved in cell wall biosynthesis
LPKYSYQGASSRYRVHQYLPFLEQAGFECVVRPLFSDRYLHSRYLRQDKPRKLDLALAVGEALGRRMWLIRSSLAGYDVVYVEYEALPYLPLAWESELFAPGTRAVSDYDDAIHVNYERHSSWVVRRMMGPKIAGIVRQSCQVIAGNRSLAEWAAQFNPNVTLIPTSVDLSKYDLDRNHRMTEGKPVIGWIGTPITAQYLRLLERPLRALRARHDFQLRVIGAPDFRMEGVEVVGLPWSEASEVRDLQACTIGVMPLSDDPWARGKSALKLVQYLAAGVVAVASPVGANCDVVKDGENGLLAASESDWVAKLALLIEQPDLRQRLTQSGRRTIEERYSVQVNAPRLVDVLCRAACDARSS